jgi:hypothetical protein
MSQDGSRSSSRVDQRGSRGRHCRAGRHRRLWWWFVEDEWDGDGFAVGGVTISGRKVGCLIRWSGYEGAFHGRCRVHRVLCDPLRTRLDRTGEQLESQGTPFSVGRQTRDVHRGQSLAAAPPSWKALHGSRRRKGVGRARLSRDGGRQASAGCRRAGTVGRRSSRDAGHGSHGRWARAGFGARSGDLDVRGWRVMAFASGRGMGMLLVRRWQGGWGSGFRVGHRGGNCNCEILGGCGSACGSRSGHGE